MIINMKRLLNEKSMSRLQNVDKKYFKQKIKTA
jgi:hypothetical protein